MVALDVDAIPTMSPVTVKSPPMVASVLIATLIALMFILFGLSMVGVPEELIKSTFFTPKLLSAISSFFIYL